MLHYCKYVGDTLLYSTENTAQSMAGSEQMAQALPGLYEHGFYPFVFDSLFPVEGSPCGYGFIDLCQNSQTQIDMMQTAFVKNTMLGATPRYFQRMDGAINEEEFLNLANPVIHVSGQSRRGQHKVCGLQAAERKLPRNAHEHHKRAARDERKHRDLRRAYQRRGHGGIGHRGPAGGQRPRAAATPRAQATALTGR